MTKIFPLAIALIILTLAGPAAADFVGGYTMDLANGTVTQMDALK
jgi:hypothetical protein